MSSVNCNFYNLGLVHVSFSHHTTYISFQSYTLIYIYIYIMSILLGFSSIYRKNENISFQITCTLRFAYDLTDHELSIKLLPLFLFHDPLYIYLCLTLIQYIHLIYAILGCRQFTFSNYLSIAIR